MSPPRTPKKQLAKYQLAPSKKRGQNFLVNPETARRIIDIGQYTQNEHIVEVGVGLGALTIELASRVEKVVGIEIDRGLIRYHQQEDDLPANVELIHGDILKLDFVTLAHRVGNPFKIIANLPYSISNPFIFKLLENRTVISQVIVMLQKEVCDRITATPGNKSYGIPTVLLSSFARVRKHLLLKPAEFHPRPEVDSEVVEISFFQRTLEFSEKNYHRLVRDAFNSRRKTIKNNLINSPLFASPGLSDKKRIKNKVEHLLEAAEIAPDIRAERLSANSFEKLALTYENLFLAND